MTLNLQQKPIFQWPGAFTKERKSSPFRAGYTDTLTLLENELFHLDATNTFLQVAMRPEDFRKDGAPRADAKPFQHPGIILMFRTKQGTLTFPCDTYTDWKANLRAIALSLEALRAVNRYGVTRRNEQYRGWTALEAPKPEPSGGPFASAEDAAHYIVKASKLNISAMEIVVSSSDLQRVYREAAKHMHPDAGGSEAEFKKLQSARDRVTAG